MGIFDNIDFNNIYGNSDYGAVGNAVNDYISGSGTSDYGIIGNSIDGYINSGTPSGSSGFGGINLGTLTNVLGKLGAGLGSGLSAYQANQQPNYIPYTRWIGNGLATTGVINNSQNKQKSIDDSFGAGQMLGNFPGYFFKLFKNRGRNNNSNQQSSYLYNDGFNANFDDIYNGNYGTIGNAINNYMRQ